jgi:hypothetical protein
MVGRIAIKQIARQQSERRRHPRQSSGLLFRQGVERVLGEVLILQDHRPVVVPSDKVGHLLVRQLDATDRQFGTQTGVEGKRIDLELRSGDVDRLQ